MKNALEEKDLYKAVNLLKSNNDYAKNPKTLDSLRRIEETYKYLVHYFVEGIEDNSREEIIDELILRIYALNDSFFAESILSESPDIYSSTKRLVNLRKISLNKLFEDLSKKKTLIETTDNPEQTLLRESEEIEVDLFSYIWTMHGADKKDYEIIGKYFDERISDETVYSHLVSALLLENLVYLDLNSLNLLIDIYEKDYSEAISARTLVSVMLILSKYKDIVIKDRKIVSRLSLWNDSILNQTRIKEVLMNIIRSIDTKRISDKLQKEIIPELMKLRPDILNQMKNMTGESDLEMLAENPEWEEMFEKSGISDKLKEITEMQMEGGDVMMLAFSNLKNFPFFNETANWFLPFTFIHSSLSHLKSPEMEPLTSLLQKDRSMCDSDKYSFALSMNQMPKAQRDIMFGRMTEQLSQLKEMMKDEGGTVSNPDFKWEVTKFVRDLYRFFKLNKRKTDFEDPFASPIDITSLHFFDELTNNEELIKPITDFYFKNGYYKEALPLLKFQEENFGAEPMIWEKIGYCHNALKNISEALIWYKKAELFNPDSLWLIKKLAVCNRILNNFKDASEYYLRALEAEPENYHLIMSAGNCFLENGEYKKALSQYYHAGYLKDNHPSPLRAAAWTEMLDGNLKKSLSLYERLITMGSAETDDFLNAGHSAFIKKDYKKALTFYRHFVSLNKGDFNKLEKAISDDKETLARLGADFSSLRFLIDNLKFDNDRSDFINPASLEIQV